MKRIPFHYQTIAAMLLGALVGSAVGPSIAPVGKLGYALIQVIKALATPLLFFVLVDSFIQAAISTKAFTRLISICVFNALLAVVIALTIANLWQPGIPMRAILPASHATIPEMRDLWTMMLDYLPNNLLEPFLKHSIPGAILLALLFGSSIRSLQKSGKDIKGIKSAVDSIVGILLQAVGWVVKFSPIAVAAVVAQSVGEKGFAPLLSLGGYIGSTLLGMALQIGLVYHAWLLWSGMNLRQFWRKAKEPVLYALGVNSSLATLPLTFKALDSLKVSPAASRLGAGLGTNFNNDGILLYESLAVLIVAQAYGMDLSLGAQFGLALTCIVTAFGVAGVPEAGIVALTLVLSSAGMSTDILPLLLTVDWIIARCRSATNVLGDMTTSIALDRMSRKS